MGRARSFLRKRFTSTMSREKSRQRECLNKAYDFCLKASKINNKVFFSIFYNIAIAFFEIENNERAEEMFQNATKIRPYRQCILWQRNLPQISPAF